MARVGGSHGDAETRRFFFGVGFGWGEMFDWWWWLVGWWLVGWWLVGWWLVGWWLVGWWLVGWWLVGWWLVGWWLVGGELGDTDDAAAGVLVD